MSKKFFAFIFSKKERYICFTSLPADFLGSRRQEGLDQECSHEETQAARKRGFSQQFLLKGLSGKVLSACELYHWIGSGKVINLISTNCTVEFFY
jgi:hypothetical protein